MKQNKLKSSAESKYYAKCGKILKTFISSKSEKRMYNTIKKLNQAGVEYLECIHGKLSRLPAWENIILK